MPSLILLNIIAAVCLLLWGLGHLKHAMMKGFGAFVRRMLQSGTKNRFLAVLSGVLVTFLVQSSTASILIMGTFISQGYVSLSSAIALALGADLGTALVAALLSLDLSALMPLLLIFGFVFYNIKNNQKLHNLGRVLSGLGLMLLALMMIKQTAAPLAESEILPVIFAPIEKDPIFGILIIGLLTWLFHSSLAMILLIVSLSLSGVIHYDFALYLVLGANVGGAIPALIASWHDPKASRLPIANAIMRVTGAAVVYPFIPLITEFLIPLAGQTSYKVIWFHVLFNIGLCILALPFTQSLAKLCEMIRPDSPDAEDPGRAKYLEKELMDTPSIALVAAERETLRLAEMVQVMLSHTITTLQTNDEMLIQKIREEDDVVDRLYGSIKAYLARLLSYEELTEEEATRAVHILTFATNLEHTGDVIDKNLMPMAEKKNRLHHDFSNEGMEEIEEFHALVLDSIKQAQQVFMSGDGALAQKMLDEKRGEIRIAEEHATSRHIKRLRDGVPETMATTSLHLDIIRDYRRINTYACSVAYDVLKEREG